MSELNGDLSVLDYDNGTVCFYPIGNSRLIEIQYFTYNCTEWCDKVAQEKGIQERRCIWYVEKTILLSTYNCAVCYKVPELTTTTATTSLSTTASTPPETNKTSKSTDQTWTSSSRNPFYSNDTTSTKTSSSSSSSTTTSPKTTVSSTTTNTKNPSPSSDTSTSTTITATTDTPNGTTTTIKTPSTIPSTTTSSVSSSPSSSSLSTSTIADTKTSSTSSSTSTVSPSASTATNSPSTSTRTNSPPMMTTRGSSSIATTSLLTSSSKVTMQGTSSTSTVAETTSRPMTTMTSSTSSTRESTISETTFTSPKISTAMGTTTGSSTAVQTTARTSTEISTSTSSVPTTEQSSTTVITESTWTPIPSSSTTTEEETTEKRSTSTSGSTSTAASTSTSGSTSTAAPITSTEAETVWSATVATQRSTTSEGTSTTSSSSVPTVSSSSTVTGSTSSTWSASPTPTSASSSSTVRSTTKALTSSSSTVSTSSPVETAPSSSLTSSSSTSSPSNSSRNSETTITSSSIGSSSSTPSMTSSTTSSSTSANKASPFTTTGSTPTSTRTSSSSSSTSTTPKTSSTTVTAILSSTSSSSSSTATSPSSSSRSTSQSSSTSTPVMSSSTRLNPSTTMKENPSTATKPSTTSKMTSTIGRSSSSTRTALKMTTQEKEEGSTISTSTEKPSTVYLTTTEEIFISRILTASTLPIETSPSAATTTMKMITTSKALERTSTEASSSSIVTSETSTAEITSDAGSSSTETSERKTTEKMTTASTEPTLENILASSSSTERSTVSTSTEKVASTLIVTHSTREEELATSETSKTTSPSDAETEGTTPDDSMETTTSGTTARATSGTTSRESTTDRRTSETISTKAQEMTRIATKKTTTPILMSTRDITTTKEITSTVTTTTEEPATTTEDWRNCSAPCPPGYEEGDKFCYMMVPTELSRTYSSALTYCQHNVTTDLVDETDFQNKINFALFKELHNENLTDIFFLNAYGSQEQRETMMVDVVLLENSTAFFVDTKKVEISGAIEGANAICRATKSCDPSRCPISQLYDPFGRFIQPPPEDKEFLESGEKYTANCKAPSTDNVEVTCNPRGRITPHPSRLKCALPHGMEFDEIEVPDNRKTRASCTECDRRGTANCTATEGGFECNCKEGWTKNTCWRSPNLCKEDSCSEQGRCVSRVDHFECHCVKGFTGKDCEIDTSKISIFGNNRSVRFFSAAAMANMAMTTSNGIQLGLKVASKILIAQEPKDPQEAYQSIRSVILTVTGIIVAGFGLPTLFHLTDFSCRIFFLVINLCYGFAFGFMLNEALQVASTLNAFNRNEWDLNSDGKKTDWLRFKYRGSWPFFATFVVYYFVAKRAWKQIPSTWTSLGEWDGEHADTWFLPAFFNLTLTIGCIACTESAIRAYLFRPERFLAVRHFMETRDPREKERVGKVFRNIPFMLFMAPLLFLSWTFMSLSYHEDTFFLNFFTLVFSMGYAGVSLLQTIITSPGLYDFLLQILFRFLPAKKPFPSITPETWLTKDEVLAKAGKKPLTDDKWPVEPKDPDFLTEAHRHHLLRHLTKEYTKERAEFARSVDDAIFVAVKPFLQHLEADNSHAIQLQHLISNWNETIRLHDTIELKLPRGEPKNMKEVLRRRIYRPPMTGFQQEYEDRMVGNFGRLSSILGYQDLQKGTVSLPNPDGCSMGEESFVAPIYCLMRDQLQDKRKEYQKLIDKLAEEEENEELQDFWLDEQRPDFVGPRKDPDLRFFPAAREYMEMSYYNKLAEIHWKHLENLRYKAYALEFN